MITTSKVLGNSEYDQEFKFVLERWRERGGYMLTGLSDEALNALYLKHNGIGDKVGLACWSEHWRRLYERNRSECLGLGSK